MKVSLVVLTKNNEDTIEECLSSIKDSSINDYEIIIVDAKSKDRTVKIAKKYTEKIFYDAGKGISEARNIGIKNSDGEFILFLDADAYVEKNCIEEMLKEFKDEKIAGVQTFPKPIVKTLISKAIGEEWQSFHELYFKNKEKMQKYIGGPCLMFRKKALQEVNGFNEEIKYGSDDHDVSYRIFKKDWKFVVLTEKLCYHHPRHTLDKLIKEYYFWAQGSVIFWKKFPELYRKRNPIIAGIFSPITAIKLTIKYKNPMHLFLYPIIRWAWLFGFITALSKSNFQK